MIVQQMNPISPLFQVVGALKVAILEAIMHSGGVPQNSIIILVFQEGWEEIKRLELDMTQNKEVIPSVA